MIITSTIVGLFALLLLRAASLSNQFKIERKIRIHRDATEIFNEIKNLRGHNRFNKWMMQDPNMEVTTAGTDGTEGFTLHWKSQLRSAGAGSQQIRTITEGKKINYRLLFEKPFKGAAEAYLVTDIVSDGETEVTWGFISKRKYPEKILHSLINFNSLMGRDIQNSLENLKVLMEQTKTAELIS
jgi:hypothetical protein